MTNNNNKKTGYFMEKFVQFGWIAPEYFSRWRLFPRAFISMYIYLLYKVVHWFMAIEGPTMEQAGLVSVIVGAGAAWFGLYVNSTSTNHTYNARQSRLTIPPPPVVVPPVTPEPEPDENEKN